MLLKIRGIGKINDSTIEMKGITVIAGENNTGKSTFGKVLYCMFNAFCNIDATVLNERIVGIHDTISQGLLFNEFNTIRLSNKLMEQILNLKNDFTAEKFRELMINSSGKIDKEDIRLLDYAIQISIDRIKQYVIIGDMEIKKNIINRYFNSEFFRQINHVNRPDVSGEVLLIIEGKNVRVNFSGNECSDFDDEVGLIHDATYIDTPFILDDIGASRNMKEKYYYNKAGLINHKDNLFYRMVKETESAIITEAIAKQKLNNVLSIINCMAEGDFTETNNFLSFTTHSMKQPIALQNLSAGMKILLIIKRLLEQGEINERDVLIFDEPEIHLHPDWQIKFAKILILLQKEFDLTILLTTHSPYFLNAIEVFSKKYNAQKECKFYLAKSDCDVSDVDDVTNDIDEVYQQMALPFQKLDDIAYADDK